METLICDNCEEEWEKEFFCEKCSQKMVEVDCEEWDDDHQFYTIGTEMESTGDVCKNCCHRH